MGGGRAARTLVVISMLFGAGGGGEYQTGPECAGSAQPGSE